MGASGKDGVNGKSAYELAVENGYEGTVQEWLASLVGADGKNGANGTNGKSAYEIAVEHGYKGAEEEWIASLAGKNGTNGTDGINGKSAYELAVENGFKGSLSDWLDSLVGEDGIDGEDGTDGKSAYELAVENGFNGTLTEWLASLVGAAGKDGADGNDGANGANGKSAYELAVENGYKGTVQEWLASFVGAKGDKGDKGDSGITPQLKIGDDNYWYVSYDNGASWTSLNVKATGENGSNGIDGRGIIRIEINDSGELIVTYTDNSVINLGQVVGADGKDLTVCQHAYGDWMTTLSPTCECMGIKMRECALCGDKEFDIVEKTEHSLTIYMVVEDTCSSRNVIYYCKKCSTMKFIAKPVSKEHNYEFTQVLVNTCAERICLHTCTECSTTREIIEDVIVEHQYEFTQVLLDTCQERICLYTCIECSATKQIAEAPTATHTFVNYECSTCGSKEKTPDEYFTFNELTGGTYSVKAKDVSNIPTKVIIPQEYNGKAVTTIDTNAFKDAKNLAEIVIFDNIKYIYDGAFYNCINLTSVVIPDSVTSIGTNVFRGCNNLTEITLPFTGGSRYASSYQSVFGYIFGYTTVKGAVTPNTPQLPANTSGATRQYQTLEEYIPYMYYYLCYDYYIPSSLRKVTITNFIHEGAFNNCSTITNIVIGSNVTAIKSSTFNNCKNLTDIVVGKNVTIIDSKAFYSCSKLTNVYYKGTNEDWSKITVGSNNSSLTYAMIYYYSKSEPELDVDETSYDGNYWHFDIDGKTPVIWIYIEKN